MVFVAVVLRCEAQRSAYTLNCSQGSNSIRRWGLPYSASVHRDNARLLIAAPSGGLEVLSVIISRMVNWARFQEKVYGGHRLSFEEGAELYHSNDIVALGRLANHTRERLNGNTAYYNVNRHINYTNVCVIDCQLCQGAYARKPGEDGGYTMQLDEVFRFAEQEYTDSLTEFHIVGGLNPELPFQLLHGSASRASRALSIGSLEGVHDGRAGFLHEDHAKKPLEWVIEQLHEAGMGSCPGGGAEIFAERARPLIAGHKISGRSMARCRAHGSQDGNSFECDDALWSHRDARRACRPSCPAARTAGRNRRFQLFYSARISS